MNSCILPINRILTNITIQLIPAEIVLLGIKQHSQIILKCLKSRSNFPIDRIFYAGSVDKEAEIMKCPVDFFCFVPGEFPPMQEILQDWREAIHNTLDIDMDAIKVTDISVEFTFINNIPTKLFPMTNEKKEGVNSTHKYFLSESQAHFLIEQSELFDSKYWYTNATEGARQIWGIKLIVELIAVAVGIEEEENHDEDQQLLVRAFAKFLEKVANIDELQMAFEKVNGKWKICDEVPAVPEIGNYYILESNNSWNDYTRNFQGYETEVQNLKDLATQAKTKLQEIMSGPPLEFGALLDLFKSPIEEEGQTSSKKAEESKGQLYSEIDPKYHNPLPSVEIRNKEMCNNPAKQERLKAVLGIVETLTKLNQNSAIVTAGTDPAESQVMVQPPETVQEVLRISIALMQRFEAVGNNLKGMIEKLVGVESIEYEVAPKHEDFDLTVILPVSISHEGPGGMVKHTAGWKGSMNL